MLESSGAASILCRCCIGAETGVRARTSASIDFPETTGPALSRREPFDSTTNAVAPHIRVVSRPRPTRSRSTTATSRQRPHRTQPTNQPAPIDRQAKKQTTQPTSRPAHGATCPPCPTNSPLRGTCTPHASRARSSIMPCAFIPGYDSCRQTRAPTRRSAIRACPAALALCARGKGKARTPFAARHVSRQGLRVTHVCCARGKQNRRTSICAGISAGE